jgi:hypothetical protein
MHICYITYSNMDGQCTFVDCKTPDPEIMNFFHTRDRMERTLDIFVWKTWWCTFKEKNGKDSFYEYTVETEFLEWAKISDFDSSLARFDTYFSQYKKMRNLVFGR